MFLFIFAGLFCFLGFSRASGGLVFVCVWLLCFVVVFVCFGGFSVVEFSLFVVFCLGLVFCLVCVCGIVLRVVYVVWLLFVYLRFVFVFLFVYIPPVVRVYLCFSFGFGWCVYSWLS